VRKHQAVKKSLSKRDDVTLKNIQYAAHIRDPKFNGEYLSRDERIQKTEIIHKVATRNFCTEHSADVIGRTRRILQ
jgi:hypothetical protein